MAWSKESRHVRGYGSAWTKLREVIIRRDMGLCQQCKREGRLNPYRKGQGFAVDHVVPKAQGGTDELGNLELKCHSHHLQKSLDEAVVGRGGKIRPTIGEDGWPIG